MRVIHSISGIARNEGGTTAYLAELMEEQARFPGLEVEALTISGQDERPPIAPEVRVHQISGSSSNYGRFLRSAASDRGFDILHVHGLWLLVNHSALNAGLDLGKRVILSTHGMLEPAAMTFSRWKKRIAWHLFQRRDLERVEVLHATASLEAENLRKRGYKQPIIVLPPGVPLPAEAEMRDWKGEPVHIALLMTRLHPIKNIEALLEAWAQLRPRHWKLVICGPDDVGYGRVIKAKIGQLNLRDVVECRETVRGLDKAALFRSASLFILPSLSENFGIVVPEALSYGVPAIATKGAPWEELEERDCGWWVEPDVKSLAEALADAFTQDADALRLRGIRGRRLVEERYQWRQIAADMFACYEWLLGPREKPVTVH